MNGLKNMMRLGGVAWVCLIGCGDPLDAGDEPEIELSELALTDTVLRSADDHDVIVDLDGDRRADVCGRKADGIYCALSNGTTGFGTVRRWSTFFADGTPEEWEQRGELSYGNYATLRFPDINGDGKADVCGRGKSGVWCGLSDGSKFSAPTLWTSAFRDLDAELSADFLLYERVWSLSYPDVNADGRADVCARSKRGIRCGLSLTSNRFGGVAYWTASDFGDVHGWNQEIYWTSVRYPDINGDGWADVCGRGRAGIRCATNNHGGAFSAPQTATTAFRDELGWNTLLYARSIRYPDINGDKRSDFCGRGVNGVSCTLSTPNGYAGVALASGFFPNGQGWDAARFNGTIRYPDLNNDGKYDICGRGANGVACALSLGSTFGPLSIRFADFGDIHGWGGDRAYWSTVRFPDVDGDGRADACGRGRDGIRCLRNVTTVGASAALWSSTFRDPEWSGYSLYETIQY